MRNVDIVFGIVLLLVLRFAEAEIIVRPAENAVADIGTDVTFHCATNLTSRIRWSFRKDGVAINIDVYKNGLIANHKRYTVTTSKTEASVVHYDLTVKNVRNDDAGMYLCRDNEGAGEWASSNLRIVESISSTTVTSFDGDVRSLGTSRQIQLENNQSSTELYNDDQVHIDSALIVAFPIVYLFSIILVLLILLIAVLAILLFKSHKTVETQAKDKQGIQDKPIPTYEQANELNSNVDNSVAITGSEYATVAKFAESDYARANMPLAYNPGGQYDTLVGAKASSHPFCC